MEINGELNPPNSTPTKNPTEYQNLNRLRWDAFMVSV